MTGDLFGWNTTRLHRVDYYQADVASDAEGGIGRWGDVLIPERDVVYGEDRSAFPFDVPAGENRLVWVDVFVPPGTLRGNHAGSLTVVSGGGSVNVPVAMEVLGIDLPSTSSLQNTFHVTYNGAQDTVCRSHTGSDTCNGDAGLRRQLHSLYSRVALENRVTLSNGFAVRPTRGRLCIQLPSGSRPSRRP